MTLSERPATPKDDGPNRVRGRGRVVLAGAGGVFGLYLGVADRGGLVEVALPLANTSLSLNPNRRTAIIQWAGLAKGV